MKLMHDIGVIFGGICFFFMMLHVFFLHFYLKYAILKFVKKKYKKETDKVKDRLDRIFFFDKYGLMDFYKFVHNPEKTKREFNGRMIPIPESELRFKFMKNMPLHIKIFTLAMPLSYAAFFIAGILTIPVIMIPFFLILLIFYILGRYLKK